ncbi:MAG: NAD(P)-dependent oxidoreductase [Candidatus Aenigmatarchaeota archaeon]
MILITGGTGRLGKYVSPMLLKSGKKIRLMTQFEERGASVVNANLFDEDSLLRACEGVDTVIHLAATLDYTLPAKEMIRINYGGTKNMLDAASKSGVSKFVFASSVSVYGRSNELPIDEENKLNAKEPYGVSKKKAEEAVKKSGIGYTILRPTVIYGKGFDAGFETIAKLTKSGKMKIIGNGKNRIHFTHAKDCAKAFYLAATKKPFNEAFNIAGPDTVTQNEALKMVARFYGVEPPTKHVNKHIALIMSEISYAAAKARKTKPKVLPEYVKVISSDRYFDITKAKKLLGYKPTIGYKTGLKDALNAF